MMNMMTMMNTMDWSRRYMIKIHQIQIQIVNFFVDFSEDVWRKQNFKNYFMVFNFLFSPDFTLLAPADCGRELIISSKMIAKSTKLKENREAKNR